MAVERMVLAGFTSMCCVDFFTLVRVTVYGAGCRR